MRRAATVALLAAALVSCAPTLEGPQLTRLPPGLGYSPVQGAISGKVAGHDVTLLRYWQTLNEPPATLTITGLRGRVTREELEAWMQEDDKRWKTTSAIEGARIDGRAGFVWSHHVDNWIGVGALSPDDDTSYLIALNSSRASLGNEAQLRAAVASFSRKPGASVKYIVPAVVAALIGLAYWAHRSRDRSVPPPVVSRPAPPPGSPLKAPSPSPPRQS